MKVYDLLTESKQSTKVNDPQILKLYNQKDSFISHHNTKTIRSSTESIRSYFKGGLPPMQGKEQFQIRTRVIPNQGQGSKQSSGDFLLG